MPKTFFKQENEISQGGQRYV